MKRNNLLFPTVTKDFSRFRHLVITKSRHFGKTIKYLKRSAHRKERRTSRLELAHGQEPQLRCQVGAWDLLLWDLLPKKGIH